MRQQFVPPDLAARSLETFGLEDRLLPGRGRGCHQPGEG